MRSRLFRQFILRPLRQDRARTITTIVGVSLGVAVVIAIQLTNQSSVRGFESALETVAGKTTIEIVGSAGIDETVLAELFWLREFGNISPVIEGEMAIVQGEEDRVRRTEALRVLGVDILRDLALRDYVVGAVASGDGEANTDADVELTQQQFLELLTSPQAVVITEKLARRRGLMPGSPIQLVAGDRVNTYIVRGLLRDEGPARVMDGSFVLMDIAAAQVAFSRLGRIDRIDVQLPGAPDSRRIDEAIAAIAERLPTGLTAQRPARRGEQVERMLAAFHTNLTALSWVALIVGLFLVYNTVTTSVIARREEIGILRALGVTSGQVRGLFLAEAAVLGLLGTVAGIALGAGLAQFAVRLTGQTVSTLYIATAAGTPQLTWPLVILGFAIGFPLALVAAWVPAHEASMVAPTAAIRGHDRLALRVGFNATRLIVPSLVLLLAAGLATVGPIGGMPIFGYVSSFVTIIAASLFVPAIVYAAARMLRGPLRRALGLEGLLAHASLTAAIPRLSISIAALAVSLSMTVAVVVMIGSFRDTVVYWVGQTLRADLFIGPAMRPTVGAEQTLSPEVIAAVRAHPMVEAVDSARNMDFVYRGNLVVLGGGTFDVLLSRGSLLFKAPADARDAVRRLSDREPVLVSEAFSRKYGVEPGDTVMLETPQGAREFPVAAVYYDYAVERGVILMDHATLTKYFGALAPSGLAAYLRQGADSERVRAEILDSLDEGHRAFIYTNRALRTEVLRIFDSTFAITYALELIAVIVAMLGVAATLFTLVVERRQELTMLRLVGALASQVRRAVMIEAAIIGGISQVIGLLVGLALAVILVYVINVQSFGWTIQFSVPVMFLLQISVVVIIATALAGFYPARRAAQVVLNQEE